MSAYDRGPQSLEDDPDRSHAFDADAETLSKEEVKMRETLYNKLIAKLQRFIDKNIDTSRGLFCSDPDSVIKFTILPADEAKLYRPQYPIAHSLREVVSEVIMRWLKEGKIKHAPANTRFNNPLLAAPKKDEQGKMSKVRVCIDPRQPNKYMVEMDRFEIPSIPNILRSLGGGKLFGEFDLKEAYLQFKVHPDSQKYLAFTWNGQQYVFTGCPFGLKHLPSFFQRYIANLFRDMPFVYPYLDNISFASKSWEEHYKHARMILERLTSVNLRIKPEQLNLGRSSIRLLGHVISEAGISLDPEKTEMIEKWPRPSDGANLASALGLGAFLRDHIRNYAEIAAPLEAIKNQKVITWTPTLIAHWDLWKYAFSRAPILKFPDLSKRFVLAVDASQTGIGGILYQPDDDKHTITPTNIVAICSKQLNDTQKRYPVYKKELWGMIYSLRKFHTFLWGRTDVTVLTDHKPLIHILNQRNLSVALQQWLDVLLDYSLNIEYRPGVLHVIPDALSRMFMSAYANATDTWGTHHNITMLENFKKVSSPSDFLCQQSLDEIKPKTGVKRRHRDMEKPEGGDTMKIRFTKCEPNFNELFQAPDEVDDNTGAITLDDQWEFACARRVYPLFTTADTSVPSQLSPHWQIDAESSVVFPSVYPQEVYPRSRRATRRRRKADAAAEAAVPPSSSDSLVKPAASAPLSEIVDILVEKQAAALASPSTATSGKDELEVSSSSSSSSSATSSSTASKPADAGTQTDEKMLTDEEKLLIAQEKRGLTVPNEADRRILLSDAHALGHYGIQAVYAYIVHQGYWWPRLREDIKTEIMLCTECRKYNVIRHGFHPLRSVTAYQPGDHLQIDLATIPPSLDGHSYILVVVDVFTGFVMLRPLRTKDAETVAGALWEIMCTIGIPKVLQSDNGQEFKQQDIIDALNKRIGVQNRFITAYTPRANGKVERAVGAIKMTLLKFLRGAIGYWPLYVPYVQYAYNQKVKSITGSSPFALMFNRTPNLPIDYSDSMLEDTPEALAAWKKHQQDVVECIYPSIRTRVKTGQDKYNAYVDGKHQLISPDKRIPNNTIVYIKDPKYLVDKSKKPMLEGTYIGPFKIHNSNKHGIYTLEDDMGAIVHRGVPIDQIKIGVPSGQPVHPDSVDDFENRWEVEKVVKHRRSNTGELEYLIKWKGYKRPTWEPESNLVDTQRVELGYLRDSVREHAPKKRGRPSKRNVTNALRTGRLCINQDDSDSE